MPQGRDSIHFNRREAMLLSVAAWLGLASAPEAHTSDDVMTAAHQGPGTADPA